VRLRVVVDHAGNLGNKEEKEKRGGGQEGQHGECFWLMDNKKGYEKAKIMRKGNKGGEWETEWGRCVSGGSSI